MTHNCSPGMSFLEMMIMLVIIGLMGAVVAPNLSYYLKKTESQEFEAKLESFIHKIKQQALLTGKTQQVYFDFKLEKVFANAYNEALSDEPKGSRFSPTRIAPLKLNKSFELQNFYIQGNDEMRSGSTRESAWFYIMPDGSSQDVVINFIYGDEEERKLGIKINPFSAQVFSYDTFKFP